MNKEWHVKVYKEKIDTSFNKKYWYDIKRSLFRFYDYICLRCDKKFTFKKLTLHHMKPREEGGTDEPENLVCMCYDCHNFIEGKGYKTKLEIISSYEEEKEEIQMRESEHTIPWQQVVYGGARKEGKRLV